MVYIRLRGLPGLRSCVKGVGESELAPGPQYAKSGRQNQISTPFSQAALRSPVGQLFPARFAPPFSAPAKG